MSTGSSAIIVVVILMTPTLLQKVYKVGTLATLQANCVATIGLTVGNVLAGWLTDRFGTARVLVVGCPLSGIAAYLLYAGVRLDSSLVMPLYALAGFTVGVFAVVPCVMIAAFPPQIRFSGISFSYNLAYAFFGGLTPILLSWLLGFDPMAAGALCRSSLSRGRDNRSLSRCTAFALQRREGWLILRYGRRAKHEIGQHSRAVR